MAGTKSSAKWPMVKLGEFYRKTKSVDPRKYPDQPFVLYSVPAFDENEPKRLVGSEIGSSKTILENGDVLLSKIVPHIRRSWVVGSHEGQVVGSSEWIVFNDERFDARFLQHFLISDIFHAKLMTTVAGVGGSLSRARPSSVALIPIPLPPLDEQRRIADILDVSQDLCRKAEHQLLNLNGLLASYFAGVFSNVVKSQPLGEMLRAKPEYGIGAPSTEFDQTIGRYIRITDITEQGLLRSDSVRSPDFSEKTYPQAKIVNDGDLLVARTGATVGKSYLHRTESSNPFWYAGYLIRFRIDPAIVQPEIVYDFMHTPAYWAWVEARKRTVAQPNINAQIYSKELKIPVPEKGVADKYLEVRKLVTGQIEVAKERLFKLNELHKSLSIRAFQGEL